LRSRYRGDEFAFTSVSVVAVDDTNQEYSNHPLGEFLSSVSHPCLSCDVQYKLGPVVIEKPSVDL